MDIIIIGTQELKKDIVVLQHSTKKEPLYIQEGIGIEKYDKEGRVLITEHDKFLLYNIYFPNGPKRSSQIKI